MKIISAYAISKETCQIKFSASPQHISPSDISIDHLTILQMRVEGDSVFLTTTPINIKNKMNIFILRIGSVQLRMDYLLDVYHSDLPLGCIHDGSLYIFRLFAPGASRVVLYLFDKFEDDPQITLEMQEDENCVWETKVQNNISSFYYGYRVYKSFESYEPPLIYDPYSRAVATCNHYLHPGKSLLKPPLAFDWTDTDWLPPRMEDLILYELHIRDFTIHPSSGISEAARGTYLGLIEEGKQSGLTYLKHLGINAVELLPIQEFANIEPSYRNPNITAFNDWNPRERNHWGYMTSCYFAPESYYSTGGSLENDHLSGFDGRAVLELKTMVDRCHRNGIAVIMDVVYNHISQFDLNPLRFINEEYYLRKDDRGKDFSESGCGNDLKTERPMTRRLICDSIRFWMEEYHIDGFRFDLAGLIDFGTLDAITETARKINPNVILIAEPWGGKNYGQASFSERKWGAWNDHFRNGIKGAHPLKDKGIIFGDKSLPDSLKYLTSGSLRSRGGPFLDSAHSVNYLASHDDWTLGDFIRLALGIAAPDGTLRNPDHLYPLSPREMQLHVLAAFILLTSRGPAMIHSGQEFARCKKYDDEKTGMCKIDHNSYNKDDETNWLNFEHMHANGKLVQIYRKLIAIRNQYPLLRNASANQVEWIESDQQTAFGYRIHDPDHPDMLVLINAGLQDANFHLPDKKWKNLFPGNDLTEYPQGKIMNELLKLPPASAILLIEEVESS